MEDVTKQRLVEEKLYQYSKELELKVLKKTVGLTKRIKKVETTNNVLANREAKAKALVKTLSKMKADSQKQETMIKKLNKEIIKLRDQIVFGK